MCNKGVIQHWKMDRVIYFPLFHQKTDKKLSQYRKIFCKESTRAGRNYLGHRQN